MKSSNNKNESSGVSVLQRKKYGIYKLIKDAFAIYFVANACTAVK